MSPLVLGLGGVDLTFNNYLESVESAMKVTKDVLALYQESAVIPLIEPHPQTDPGLRGLRRVLVIRSLRKDP